MENWRQFVSYDNKIIVKLTAAARWRMADMINLCFSPLVDNENYSMSRQELLQLSKNMGSNPVWDSDALPHARHVMRISFVPNEKLSFITGDP